MNKKQNQNTRLTIGFLNASGDQFFHLAWCGIADVAREHNINALCFESQYVRSSESFKAQANILYDLVDTEQLDGLVIQDIMCNMLDPDEALQFYKHYRPLPIVSIGRRSIEEIPCVQSSGYAGMRQAIVHLIEVHSCSRIAFIKGLPNYRPHEERYQAYIDVLAEYDLPFDLSRVAVPKNAAEIEHQSWGCKALRWLLDDQKAGIDALVTNDDRFAHELLPELQVRGIRVPGDIALVSFDDMEGSNCLTPPLTTVPIPIYEMGRQAAMTLMAKIKGQKKFDKVVDVPSDRLIVRQSCGCLDPKVIRVAAGPVSRTGAAEPLEISLKGGQREKIIADMIQATDNSAVTLNPDWAEHLLDNFVAVLTNAETGEGPSLFLSTLDEILRQVISAKDDIEVWQQVLSSLRRQLLPYLNKDENDTCYRDKAEDLWLQAQMMIVEVDKRIQSYQNLQAEQRRRILSDISIALTTNFDVNNLVDILARELPRLGISRGYLSLYEKPIAYKYPQPAPEWSRLMLAYDERLPSDSKRVRLEPGGRRFPSRQLVPDGIFPQNEQYNLIVHALYFQNEQIGFILLDGNQPEGDVYEMLRTTISSALKGALLVQQVQKRSAELIRQQYILNTFMKNIPDCVYFKDMESRFTRNNQAHADKLGLNAPAEVIGRSDFDFFPKEQAQIKFEQEQEIIRTGKPLLNLEESDGMGNWMLTTKMPLRDENGLIIGTFGISHNITAMKKAQEELMRKERLSVLGQLTATVAHEIRNPLGTVRTCIFTIADAIERNRLEQVKRALLLAERNIIRCDNIITELLDFTRNRALQLSPANIDKWLSSLLDEILDQGNIPESITCSRELNTNIEISVDTEHLRRVVINIINNAIDAMQECGENENRLTISTNIVDKKLLIQICDTGCGISKEMADKLFEPLFSTKSFGIGLGLSIVKNIMEQHYGGIEIKNQPDKGAVVTLWLPISIKKGE